MLSRWRQTSATLAQSTYTGDSISQHDPRQRNVRDLVEALDKAVGPSASERSNDERKQNLKELVDRGAMFGFALFAQPASWAFDWHGTSSKQEAELIVFPALVRTADEHGQSYGDPDQCTEAQTVRVSPALLSKG